VNADDRLSLDPHGPVEGSDGIVEGNHFADVCSCLSNDSPKSTKARLVAQLMQIVEKKACIVWRASGNVDNWDGV
jgi:hypothetical protein